MKNAAKNADVLRGLLKTFVKDGKATPPSPRPDPLKALVRGAMSYSVPDGRADEAMAAIDREFVNLNELRVATELEIQEMLGTRYPAIEQRVELITRSLNSIFEKEHTLSLDRLKTVSKRDARQYLREMPGINPFTEGYVMLMAFDAPAMPLDAEMLACLREAGAFDEKTTVEDAQRFIENTLKGEEMLDFFAGLRRLAGTDRSKQKAPKPPTK